MKPAIIKEIEKILGEALHLAPARGEDTVSGVMPVSNREPFRYALRGKHLAGLNLAGAGLTDAKWQTICQLDLTRLEALNLRDNELTRSPLPPGMNNLRYLDLSGNQLEALELPEGNEDLEHIWLYGNPKLATPPPEIVSQGRHAIYQYFRSINRNRSTAKRLYEAKMLILGEGGAGKTSLARRLKNRTAAMPTEEESTRGIDILSYEFKTPDGDTFLLKLWDFAGQDIYHAIHQFFLTRRSLYVLVDSTRYNSADLPDNALYYWFRVAELYGDNSPLLLVQNEIADRSKDINFKGYSSTFTFIRQRFAVNIDSKRGLDELAEAVASYAMQLPHVGELWSESWTNARAALEKRAEQEPYIAYETYIQVVIEQGVVDEEEAIILSGFLHDLGVILHFREDPVLKQLVILRNYWATDAVYKVLDCKEVKDRLASLHRRILTGYGKIRNIRFASRNCWP